MPYHWSIHQLTEYLVAVGRSADVRTAVMVTLERAAEAVEAEFGVVRLGDVVVASTGFGATGDPSGFLDAAARQVQLPGLGTVHLTRGRLDTPDGRAGTGDGVLVLGRLDDDFSAEERHLLQGMALMLGMRLQGLATLTAERQRHHLLEHLLQIQRAIAARQQLAEVLDAVTASASALLDDSPVALVLSGSADSRDLQVASDRNFPDVDQAVLEQVRRTLGRDEPDGGDAAPQSPPRDGGVLVERVVTDAEVVGALVARRPETSFGGYAPEELLAAFAQQVNLALIDARTLDAVRAAQRDPVTSLPNRALFLQRLDQERSVALAEGTELTVLFVDLDRFKAVNDTMGHGVGDRLLADVAHRILNSISDRDTVARLGGDEFAVLLRGAGTTLGGTVAERVITTLAKPFETEGGPVLIGASVGVASLTARRESASELLSDADVAMYQAKRSGRGRWLVFDPTMHQDVANQLRLRTDLRNALPNGELWLAYQPLVDLSSGEIAGLEALLRWDHPERGPVPPLQFIPIAEESDLVHLLGEYAIRTGLADLARWRAEYPTLHLALNVSARQVTDPRLPRLVSEVLAEQGLPGWAVTLEITESQLMSDPEAALEGLAALRALGVRLSLDDFGTGYSSLAYLRQFPVDQVKIDRSFVAELRGEAEGDVALLCGIIDLCRTLRLQTVAEGVERCEQFNLLRRLGCDLAQGYHLARPAPARENPHRLRTPSGRRPR